MSIGAGIALIVIGAILTFALNFDDTGWVNLDLIGYILMGAGLITVIIGLVLLTRRRQSIATTRTAADPVSGDRVTQRVSESDDPIV